jgi:selenium metabolism protein YedF
MKSFQPNDYLVLFKSQFMGVGDDELGGVLIRGFMNNLSGRSNLPTHIILYNAGVKLALKGSDTANALKAFEDKGVSIIICGTCSDFFAVRDQIGVGEVSNMATITELLTTTPKIVAP